MLTESSILCVVQLSRCAYSCGNGASPFRLLRIACHATVMMMILEHNLQRATLTRAGKHAWGCLDPIHPHVNDQWQLCLLSSPGREC